MAQSRTSALEGVKGRVVYVLAVMLLLQFTYPVSLLGPLQNALYLAVYLALLASGVYVASVNRRRFLTTFGVALLNLAVGLPWVLTNGEVTWLTFSTYGALVLFQGLIVFALLEFVAHKNEVTRDVIYAAVTVYILFGNMFSALFMIVQTLDPRAFAAPGDAPVVWQRMVYFSYSTLTTSGYGDIVPRSAWAQSLASVEAMVGLLYIAVIIGQLVGKRGR